MASQLQNQLKLFLSKPAEVMSCIANKQGEKSEHSYLLDFSIE